MNIPTYYKRLFSFVLSLVMLLSAFTLVFAEGEEAPPVEETTPVEESVPSEEPPPVEESVPSEEPPPAEESVPSEEPPPVEESPIDNFEALKAAIESGKKEFEIVGSIEFLEPISIPEMSYKLHGGELINAQFSGLGHITFTSTKFSGTLTASSRAMLRIDGNAPSIIANDSTTVTVLGNVITDGNGISIHNNSLVIVSGNVEAGGVGVVAEGGSFKVEGAIKSGSDGIQYSNASSIKQVGSISAANGIMYRDLGGNGGTFQTYTLGQTFTIISAGEIHILYNGADYTLHAIDPNAPISFSISTDPPAATDNIVGFEIFTSFTLSSDNCTASLTYKNEYRIGASSMLLQTDGTAFTELSGGKYNGSFTVENAENSTVCLALTTSRYTVTTTVGENGSLSYSNSETFLEGEVIEFIATPNENYAVDVFTINGETINMSGGKYYYTILSDTTVNITFKFALRRFTVEFRQTIGGTVSRKGIVTVTEGDSLTFEMTPDDGYYLSMIEINKELMERKTVYTIENITEDLIVFITFKQSKTYSIVLKHTAGGTVTADDTDVYYGGSTKIRITPAEGYMVDKVIADFGTLSTTSDPNIYRLKNITVDTTVTVSFKKINGDEPPTPTNMLKVSDVSWDYHPIRLELFEYTVISEEVIEKLKRDYPTVEFTIVGEGFNWIFKAGDAESFPSGNLDFGITVGKSKYEETHEGFAGGEHYVSVSMPEGLPTVGELKVFVGRVFLGLPFFGYSYDGNTYEKVSEGTCDAYFEISIPLGYTEIFMLCNGKPTNIVTITIEGDGTATPSAPQYIRDGESLKIIFTPADTSYIYKVTVNGEEHYMRSQVLQLDNITENIDVICIFSPHESTETSRYSLPIIEDKAEIIAYVFALVGVACYLIYIVLRKSGSIKYKREL